MSTKTITPAAAAAQKFNSFAEILEWGRQLKAKRQSKKFEATLWVADTRYKAPFAVKVTSVGSKMDRMTLDRWYYFFSGSGRDMYGVWVNDCDMDKSESYAFEKAVYSKAEGYTRRVFLNYEDAVKGLAEGHQNPVLKYAKFYN